MQSYQKTLFAFFSLTTLIFLLIISPASGTQTVFGPKTYSRSGGPPQIITDSFSATAGSQYKLVLTNNGLYDTGSETAADSFIYLNGSSVVGVHNFSQSTATLEVPVELQTNNTLEVEVRGVESGSITVEIVSDP